jgi:hypothetical protein
MMRGSTTAWRPELVREMTRAYDDLAAALRWCNRHDTDPQRAWRLCASMWAAVHQGRADDIVILGRQTIERWPFDGSTLAGAAVATLATAKYVSGEPHRAIALAELTSSTLAAPSLAAVTLRRVLGQARRAVGDVPAALAAFRNGTDLARLQLDMPAMAIEFDGAQAQTFADDGRIEEALQALRASVDESVRIESVVNEAWARTCLGWVRLRVDAAEGLEEIAGALEMSQRIAYPIGIAVNLRSRAGMGGGLPRTSGDGSRSKGVADLAVLVASPGREHHCLDLIGAGAQEGSTGEVIDAAARRAYEARIGDLQEELDDAEMAHDLARASAPRPSSTHWSTTSQRPSAAVGAPGGRPGPPSGPARQSLNGCVAPSASPARPPRARSTPRRVNDHRAVLQLHPARRHDLARRTVAIALTYAGHFARGIGKDAATARYERTIDPLSRRTGARPKITPSSRRSETARGRGYGSMSTRSMNAPRSSLNRFESSHRGVCPTPGYTINSA